MTAQTIFNYCQKPGTESWLRIAGRTVAPIANATLPRVAAAAGATAALLQLSAVLYSRGAPYPIIHAALAPCALGMWAVLDRSLQVRLLCPSGSSSSHWQNYVSYKQSAPNLAFGGVEDLF